MKITVLLENTACRADLCAAHGLSLYIEACGRRVLFDMGPDEGFLQNAGSLGVDLTAVDLAVLSHGHDDHGGGLAAFCRVNPTAPVYVHRRALGRPRQGQRAHGSQQHQGPQQLRPPVRFFLPLSSHRSRTSTLLFSLHYRRILSKKVETIC